MTGCYEPTWQACPTQAGLPVLNPRDCLDGRARTARRHPARTA